MNINYQKLSKKVLTVGIAVLTVVLMSVNVSLAQVALYGVSPLTGQTYQSLTGGTVINSDAQLSAGNADDGRLNVVMPFAFPYNGSAFDSVTFCTNYWIAFGHQATNSTSGAALFSTAIPTNALAAFWRDGSANFGTTGEGEMRHGLDGNTGIYVFEWFQASGNSWQTSATIRITFQIRLHGPSSANPGRIEYLYGPSTGAVSTGAASIGIKSAGGTGNYLNALNGASNSTTTTTAYPGNGAGYRFNPPASMTFSSAAVLGVTNAPIVRGATNAPIYALNVVTQNALNPLSVSSINIGALTQNLSNIDSVKVFYSGSSTAFTTATQFGSSIGTPVAGANVITGTQTLGSGNNFFWITYNVSNTATIGDSLSGQVASVTVGGTAQTPSTTQSSTRRLIQTPLTGTVTVGTGGQYANLGAAFSDINNLGLSGNTILSIVSNITEPAAAQLNQWAEAGAGGYTLTIRPSGPNRVISGNTVNTGLIVLAGADRVIIDGRIGGSGTARDLTFRNDNNSSLSIVFFLAGQTTAAGGCNDVTIRNTILIGGSTVGTTTGTAAIWAQGTGAPSNNLVITDNDIRRSYRGISIGVNAPTSPYLGLQITNNILGSNDPLQYNTFRGIQVNQSRGAIISGNTIFNQVTTLGINIAAIEILTGSDSAVISANKIHTIQNPSTGGWGAYGINLGAGNGHLVVNNDIANVSTTNYSATSNTFNAFGLRMAAGTGHRVYYNTVHMSGAYTSTNTTAGAAAVCITGAAVTAEMLNNNFSNTITSTASGNKNLFAIWLPTATYAFTNLTGSNYNNYNIGSEPYHVFAQRGTSFGANTIANLAAWQTATALDANSIAVNPLFLTLDAGLPNAPGMNNLGTPITTVTTDVNGLSRSATPDMGAYEYTPITTDMAAVSLSRISGGCFGNAENIRMVVRNTGLNAIQFGTDTLRATLNVSGSATATLNAIRATGTLAPNDTLHLIVGPVNLAAFGNYTMNGVINQQNDGFAANNAFQALSLSNQAPLAVPFAYDFEAPLATTASLQGQGWSFNGSWLIGASSHGNPGNGLYSNIWSSNQTPQFALPFSGPVLASSSFSFNYRMLNFTSYGSATQTAYTPGPADSIWFEISSDCGLTFQRLFTISASTHTADTAWSSVSIPMANYAGQNVTIRLRSQWATGDYFLDMDNIGITAPLSAFSLVAPPNNTRLVAAGAGSAAVNVSWTSAIQGPATYTWLVDAPTGNFSNPLVVLPANNGGLDTNLTLTISQVHNLLGTLGVAIGDSANIIWTVRAQLGTQILQATQTWAAKLVRGTIAPLRFVAAPVFNGGTTGIRAPNGTVGQTFFRASSFVPVGELAAAGIQTGATISALAFRTTAGANAAVRGKMSVYLANGQNATYTRGAAWAGAITGLNIHHDDSVTIQTGVGTMLLQFSQPFVYTGGSIELAYEWIGSAPFATVGAIYAANTALAGSLVSGISATVAPATLAATAFRPEFIWGVDDRKANDIEVVTMFAKGSNPRNYGTPETIQAIVRNNGYEARTNVPVTLGVAGANTFTNVQTVASLAPDSSQLITFSAFTGTTLGFNNITASVPADENNANNNKAWAQQQTDSIYSYNDTVTVGNAGVGYNTGAGLLLTRYSINGTRSVAAARIRIADGAAIAGNSVFAVVIIDSVIVAQSGTVVLTAADLNSWVVFPFPAPVNITNGNFYIGLAQTANAVGYFPVAFQAETPTRANAYFTAPVAGGVPPSTVAGFRLMIEAHVGPEFIPADTLSRFNLVAPSNNTTLNIQGDPAQTAQIRWRTATRVGGVGTTTYEWLLDVPAGDFSNPVLRVNAGADTSLTLTFGQIVDSLAAKGVQVGSGFAGRWNVLATNGPVSRLANIPFTITLNRGVMTSIEETDFSKSISLYPNPAAYSAKLQINAPGEKELVILIVNAVGQEMKKFNVSSSIANDIELDLTNLNQGLYFVRVTNGSEMAIKRLMIQR